MAVSLSHQSIPARFNGICPNCYRAILADEHQIAQFEGQWMHLACAEGCAEEEEDARTGHEFRENLGYYERPWWER